MWLLIAISLQYGGGVNVSTLDKFTNQEACTKALQKIKATLSEKSDPYITMDYTRFQCVEE